ATAFKDNLVRADDLPLVLGAAGAQGLPRGARVRVRLGDIDEITLDVHGSVTERLDLAAESPPEAAEEDDEEAGMAAGPISIAVDMNEPAAEAGGDATGEGR
ncbi:MAG: ribonuclease, partial [Polaromonas sp.]|nr:ribonuclease [Polaromonas sp.]